MTTAAERKATPAMIATCPTCAGLRFAHVEEKASRKEMAKEIARCICAGYHVTRTTVGAVRSATWCECDA